MLPTAEEGRQSLRDHVVLKATQARMSRAGLIDSAAITGMLADRAVVRYPLGIRFDAEPLQPGEFACLEPLGAHPADGFCLFVHPMLKGADDILPMVVAYYIPSVNYGEVASHVEAELFGATLLGVDVEDYYRQLCHVADSVAPPGQLTP